MKRVQRRVHRAGDGQHQDDQCRHARELLRALGVADDADALTASKYGAERAPEDWDVGQEHEAEQTFLRRGLPNDILKKLSLVGKDLGDYSLETVKMFYDDARAAGFHI